MRADPRSFRGRLPAFSYCEVKTVVGRRPADVSLRGGDANRETGHEVLCCDQVPITTLAARYRTPLYVYSASTIRQRFSTFDAAFRHVPHTICYSVKANSNLAILRLLNRLGCGFDVVSGGELQRILRVDRRANRRVVFSGVGKTVAEMDLALNAGILLFNIESESELRRLAERATRLKKTAQIALRVNPDVPADTHPYIATGLQQHKFGIPLKNARELYTQAASERFLRVAGVSIHIGSQITSPAPFGAAMNRVAELVQLLGDDGHRIEFVDAGGGLGIWYDGAGEEFSKYAARYAAALTAPLRGLDIRLLLEPGRAIVGPAGALITSVQYVKTNDQKQFLVVDAAMNDLIRPSLYGAFHEIVPVRRSRGAAERKFDVVGPVCETGDFFARDRHLPEVAEGELLAVLDTGAYGMALSSNYNSRTRAVEVLVDGKSARLIRRRESFADLVRAELS